MVLNHVASKNDEGTVVKKLNIIECYLQGHSHGIFYV